MNLKQKCMQCFYHCQLSYLRLHQRLRRMVRSVSLVLSFSEIVGLMLVAGLVGWTIQSLT